MVVGVRPGARGVVVGADSIDVKLGLRISRDPGVGCWIVGAGVGPVLCLGVWLVRTEESRDGKRLLEQVLVLLQKQNI